MDTLSKKILAVIVAILALFGIGSGVNTLGSIQDGQAYTSTTTGSFSAATSTLIKTGGGTLGSVVIGVTSATTFVIKDANSISDSASTTLVSIAASPAIGSTMTLDVAYTRGLFIDFPGSHVGRYTVTYR